MEKLIVFLVIIVFSIIKSMIDKSAERKAMQARPMIGKPPANHKDKVQSEIEAFLTEVRAGTTAQGEVPPADSSMRSPASGSPFAAGPGQQQPAPQRPNKPQRSQSGRSQSARSQQGQPKSGQRNQSSARPPRKRAEPAAPTRATSTVRATAEEYERQQIGLSVQSNRRSQIDEHVRADMSGGIRRQIDEVQISDNRKSTSAGSMAASFVDALRSPSGMRQAIIVSEILSRPRSLR